jgi:chromate reductase, NAD(P)H dehydrogenase (quinone)
VPNVLLINGSLRSGSVHAKLLRVIEPELSRLGVSSTTYEGVRSLPLYDEDLEAGENSPPEVLALRAAVTTHDAIVFATPTYNYAMPGGLKNVLDWVSRPFAKGCIGGCKVGVLAAAPGPGTTTPAGEYLGKVLGQLGAVLVAPVATVPKLFEVCDEVGEVTEGPRAQMVELARAIALGAKGAVVVETPQQFELRFGGNTGALAGFAEYRVVGDRIELPHTVTDPAFSGQGVGSVLIRSVLDRLATDNKRVLPSCSFVAKFIEKNPEYQQLL